MAVSAISINTEGTAAGGSGLVGGVEDRPLCLIGVASPSVME